jgi:hypothetical protein
VHAVAMNSNGNTAGAIQQLQRVHTTHPYDREVLFALVEFIKPQVRRIRRWDTHASW